MKEDYLPTTRKEMKKRGWTQCDFIIVTGDAYVDHPSFGAAIISRLLEKFHYKVGIIAQPDWKNLNAFTILGEPKYAFLVTAGNIDSMVNHYTAAKKRRSTDAYSPGGKTDLRPDRATIVYTNRIREAAPGIPVIIGGIEASLRRFAHYDYWSNKVKHSILTDSQADMLIYGMAENAIFEVSRQLSVGRKVSEIIGVRGTMIPWKSQIPRGTIELPSFELINENKQQYAKAFWEQYNQQDPYRGRAMYQDQGRTGVIQYPPAFPLSIQEMDDIYDLPYVGSYHPKYESLNGVPAIKEVEFSLVSARGCYGSCSFCALTFHQGRIVQGRSHASIINEAKRLTGNQNFKGFIHDVGGPTANFRKAACTQQLRRGACSHRQCLFPEPCSQLELDHNDYLELLKKLRSLPKVKKVFVRSGIRYDAVIADTNTPFLEELCKHYVSGQLKVAPEHVSNNVLKRMGKPSLDVYQVFTERFQKVNEKLGKNQYIIPYLMSSHPGSTLRDAVILAEYVRDMGVNPEQVQDFIPTPGTLSTCMYYTGLDPRTMEKVYVPRSMHEKAMQRALIQYRDPKNYELVKEALIKVGREDLIGYGPKCLIRPKSTSIKNENYLRKDDKQTRGKRKENTKAKEKPQTEGNRNEKGNSKAKEKANGKLIERINGKLNKGKISSKIEKSSNSKRKSLKKGKLSYK